MTTATSAFLNLPIRTLAEAERDRSAAKQSSPYGEWCRDPKLCAGKGYCPRDPNCGE